MTVSDQAELTTKGSNKPEKSLVRAMSNKGGRNNNGRITVRFQGGGHKRRYRLIDFKRDKYEVPAKVVGIEYDPNRSANIALLSYADGEKRYILAPAGLNAGDQVITSDSADIKPGNCLRLSAMPMGTVVHGIEMKPGKVRRWCALLELLLS